MIEKEVAVSGDLSAEPGASVRVPLASRRGLLTAAVLAIAAGLALNWNWLVATGLAPIVIAVLPCLVMCGLGLCMNKLTGDTCENPARSKKGDL